MMNDVSVGLKGIIGSVKSPCVGISFLGNAGKEQELEAAIRKHIPQVEELHIACELDDEFFPDGRKYTAKWDKKIIVIPNQIRKITEETKLMHGLKIK